MPISYQNMRIKPCPFESGYQQILTYATITEKEPKTYIYPHLIYAHGSKQAIKRLDEKLEKHGIKQKQMSGGGYFAKLYWPESDEGSDELKHFYEECEKMSNCHIAYKIFNTFKNHYGEKYCSYINRYRSPGRTYVKKKYEPFFSLNFCILNHPGTLFSLLSLADISEINNRDHKNNLLHFDFNIEHARSTTCRVRDNVKIDFFGFFTKQKHCESGNIADFLNNIKVIVCSYANDDLKKIIRKFIANSPDEKAHFESKAKKEKDHEIYLLSGSREYKEIAGLSEKITCPIARVAGCPAEEEPPNDIKKRQAIQKLALLHTKNMIKIEVCLDNIPGSFKRACEIIGTVTEN